MSAFLFHELLTLELQRGANFYSACLGWNVEEGAEGHRFVVDQKLSFGLRLLPERARAQGAPANWLSHLPVNDLAGASAKVRELGGLVLGPARPHLLLGSFVIARDPQGAVVGLAKPNEKIAANQSRQASPWVELYTTDTNKAWLFYSGLLGWTPAEEPGIDLGETLGRYREFSTTVGMHKGGMLAAAKLEGVSTHWLCSFPVVNLAATLEKVRDHGGNVITGPRTTSLGRRFAYCEDVDGAAFGLSQGL